MLLGASLFLQKLWVSEYFPQAFKDSASVVFFSPEFSGAGAPSVLFSELPLGFHCAGFSGFHTGTVFFFTRMEDGSTAGELVLRGFLNGKPGKSNFRMGISPVVDLSFYSFNETKGVLPSFGLSLGTSGEILGFRVGFAPAFILPPFQSVIKLYVMRELSGFFFTFSSGVAFSETAFLPRIFVSVAKKFIFPLSGGSDLYVGTYEEYFSVPHIGVMISFRYAAFRVSYLMKYDWFSEGFAHVFEVSMRV